MYLLHCLASVSFILNYYRFYWQCDCNAFESWLRTTFSLCPNFLGESLFFTLLGVSLRSLFTALKSLNILVLTLMCPFGTLRWYTATLQLNIWMLIWRAFHCLPSLTIPSSDGSGIRNDERFDLLGKLLFFSASRGIFRASSFALTFSATRFSRGLFVVYSRSSA